MCIDSMCIAPLLCAAAPSLHDAQPGRDSGQCVGDATVRNSARLPLVAAGQAVRPRPVHSGRVCACLRGFADWADRRHALRRTGSVERRHGIGAIDNSLYNLSILVSRYEPDSTAASAAQVSIALHSSPAAWRLDFTLSSTLRLMELVSSDAYRTPLLQTQLSTLIQVLHLLLRFF